MRKPTIYNLAEFAADVAGHATYNVTGASCIDARGHVSIMAVFPTAQARLNFFLKYSGAWIVAGDRATHLAYNLDWKDANGYGLQLAPWASAWEREESRRNAAKADQRRYASAARRVA